MCRGTNLSHICIFECERNDSSNQLGETKQLKRLPRFIGEASLVSEEHAVRFTAKLREVNRGCRRRNKPETVPSAPSRCCLHANTRRALKEVARELVSRITES